MAAKKVVLVMFLLVAVAVAAGVYYFTGGKSQPHDTIKPKLKRPLLSSPPQQSQEWPVLGAEVSVLTPFHDYKKVKPDRVSPYIGTVLSFFCFLFLLFSIYECVRRRRESVRERALALAAPAQPRAIELAVRSQASAGRDMER